MSDNLRTECAVILRAIGHRAEAQRLTGYGHLDRPAHENPWSGACSTRAAHRTPLRTLVGQLVRTHHGARAAAIMSAATVLDYAQAGGAWDDETMTEKRQARRFTGAERKILMKPLP